MSANLPTTQDIRSRLESFRRTEMQALSEASGVPFTTLWKIRVGETKNPGIETVRMFYGYMDALENGQEKKLPAPAQQAQAATNSEVQGVA